MKKSRMTGTDEAEDQAYGNDHSTPKQLKKFVGCRKLPIGPELNEFLTCWHQIPLSNDGAANNAAFFALRWAISDRAQEVLNYLDSSPKQIHQDIAYKIREIAAKDRPGYTAIAAYAFGLFGWLGKELGNKTWIEPNGIWEKYRGEMAIELGRKHPERSNHGRPIERTG